MQEKLTVPFESYVLFPSIFALSVIAIDHSELTSWIKFILLCFLFFAAFRVTRDCKSVLLFLAAVLIEKSLIFHPLVSYGVGVGIGLPVLLSYDPPIQTRLASALGILFSIALLPLTLPESFLRWLPWAVVLLLLAALARAWKQGTLELGEIALNPFSYLDPDLLDNAGNSNRDRLVLYLSFFLVLGGPMWGQLNELFDFRIAALVHLFLTVTLFPSLLAALQFPFDSTTTALVPAYPSQTQNPDQEKRIAQLEAERQLREREALLDSEKRFYFDFSWDQLAGRFTNHLQTRLPDGSTVRANDHLFLGVASYEENGEERLSPVLLHRRILEEHVHILGGTGSGKTSLGIMPILTQLIRGHATSNGDGSIHPSDPQPIVVFDIKGDNALFHTAREEARVRGQEFLFFTVDPTKASFYFNPFQALRRNKSSTSEQAHQLLDALSLNHGERYGASYFTKIGRQALLQVLREHGTPQSLKDLYDTFRRNPKRQKKAEELYAALEGLIDYPQLFTTKEQEEREIDSIIDFDRVLERNQVVYFSLTAPTQSLAVREIGKLAIYSFFMAAIKRHAEGQGKQSFLIIDEFQRLVGENLAQIVEQARGFGVSAILANQNIAQLKGKDAQLWDLVNANVRASLHFGSADPEEKKLLSQVSGEIIERMHSTTTGKGKSSTNAIGVNWSQSHGDTYGDTRTWTTGSSKGGSEVASLGESSSEADSYEDTYRPRFPIENLGEWFNQERQFMLWVRRGSGYSDFGGRPIKVRGFYTIDEFTYKKRKALPWPDGPRPSFDAPKGKGSNISKDLLLSQLDNNFNE